MAKKTEPTPTAAPTLSENRQPSASKASQDILKHPKPQQLPRYPTNTEAPHNPIQNAEIILSPIQKGKGIEIPETPKQSNSSSVASTSNNGAALRSSPLSTALAIPSRSSSLASPSDPMLFSQTSKSETNSAPNIATKIGDFLHDEVFRLAAATPVPISPIIERQFHESQLLLHVLEKVRGKHKKRQNYHGELDQDETELRRSFVDKLAYICDFKKGGSTVTALALQKTYQGVTFWIGANETIKPKVIEFLQQILQVLKTVNGASRQTAETLLLALIVPFNEKRLDYYWTALKKVLPLCMERIDDLESSADAKPPPKELTALKTLLSALPKLSETRIDLLTASGNAHCKFFDDIRHLLGRLGEHLKATKTIVSAALRFPAILDEFEIKARASPPARCYFQSSHSITLDGIASRIFTKDDDVIHYQEALETLEQTSNGALLSRLHQECLFKTRVHAELLLADFFYWHQFDFVADDPYIGCSKPACFNCFQYILAHPGNFALPACHNKLYLAWRTPDIGEDTVPVLTASRIREAITSKMNSNIRAELRRQIDGRYAKKAAQYDSVTGTSSSINVGRILQPPASISEDEGDYMSAQEYLPSGTSSPSRYLRNVTSEMGESYDSSFCPS
ncbi:hypothetical protein VE02_05607 [Pseudogymnoascus sp. 03VT05]|nr:hypothetical protein VE02_05607 [Pseudogymnoascus sp. 03VT05]